MGVGEGGDRDGTEKDGKRDRDGREKHRETGAEEREIGRETGVGERDRQTERDRERQRQGRKRRSDRGEREKITNTKKFMEFYLVVLYSAERSEARQRIVARQVPCYNTLSFFNPVTRDKV